MNVISVTPTVSGTAYTAGDAVGGQLRFEGIDPVGLLHSVVILDTEEQAAPLDLVVFNQTFTATADNSPFSIASNEEDRIVGVISMTTYANLGNVSVGVLRQLGLPFKPQGDDQSTLYAQLIARDAVTFTGVNPLTVQVGVLSDGGF